MLTFWLSRSKSIAKSAGLWALLAGSGYLLLSTPTLIESFADDSGSTALPPAQSTIQHHAQLVQEYCVVCHNQALETGGLALDSFALDQIDQQPQVWERVLRKLRANAMPPSGMPRPESDRLNSFVAYLENSLDNMAIASPNPGRTATFNRLNRIEYQNTIRDLLALDVDVSELLPPDDSSYGFDNVNLSNLSPTLMERYLSAAQKLSRLALGAPLHGPTTHVEMVAAKLTQEDHIEGLPFGTRGGTAFYYNFPRDGTYQIDVLLARDRNENVEGLTEPHEMEISVDGERIGLYEIVPNRSEVFALFYYSDEEVGSGLQATIPIQAGSHNVAVTFLKKNSALVESTRQPYQARFNRDRHPRQQPAVHSVSIAGPFDSSGIGSTPSRERVLICDPIPGQETVCATKILLNLAQQAFRRPVTEDDIRMPLAYFAQANADKGFEAGIELGLRALLVSPEFIFRIEEDPDGIGSGQLYTIDAVDLASRLSFFLWSSIPDRELIELAANNQLRDPQILSNQVQRMLRDPKASALASNFASQWLYLRNLNAVDPNTRLFPDFDDNLRQAMRKETELLFTNIIQKDKNVMELLTADYTFLNERLAKHYGIPNVYGDHFREVGLGPESQRLGLLGHGSILTVTSYATRTSPVQRGKWVLENILGIPPPPPPDDVPALSEEQSEVRVMTMRERMAEHRANPACASCHQVMDPVGLAMENFDAIGRWRENNSDHSPIDVSGKLPGSLPFAGITGLRQALLKTPDAFIGTMSEKLLTYALGRGLEYYDGPAIREIVRTTEAGNNQFSSMILAIVNSTPFQMRRSQ